MSDSNRQYFVYILHCRDGSYYVGSTSDVLARLDVHNSGKGPGFTACRRPVRLVHTEAFTTIELARRREIQIKKWSRAKKEALIADKVLELHKLSRRRQR